MGSDSIEKGRLEVVACHTAPMPNIGLEPTPYSVRCAPASGRGSCPASDMVD